MTTETYCVERVGWNAANQSSGTHPQAIQVWRGEAPDAEAAVRAAVEAGVTCYNGQFLSARPASEVEAEADSVRAVIDGFFKDGTPGDARIGTYRPNGGVATWQYYDVEDDFAAVSELIEQDWEGAEVRDGELILFRHDGPVLHYQSIEEM